MSTSDHVQSEWRKSSLSADAANCVEVALVGGEIALRHSRQPDGPILVFSAAAWRVFLQGLREDTFTG
jgi:hypothetical protein